jgi:hypothetical protein
MIRILGLVFLFATWAIGQGGWLLLLACVTALMAAEYGWRFFRRPGAGPYPWMLLAPLLLQNYASVTDFRIRLACFFMLVYVLALAQCRERSRLRISLSDWPGWRVWLLAFTVFALAAAAIHSRGIQLSGDEPHYLMVAQSLVEDGDADLKNNLRDRTYRPFMPVDIAFHGTVWDGKYHTFHLPGVAFLMVPFFYLFSLSGGLIPAGLFFRLSAALISAFFALGLFQILKKVLPGEDHGGLFLFFLVTFPLVFHAVHLYPELPAATLLIFAYLCSRGRRQRAFMAGLLLSATPWFHLKYVLPASILAAFVVAGIWRENAPLKSRMRRLFFFAAAPALSAALLMLYSKALYGSFNPLTISPDQNVFAIPLWPRMETLLSFFLDQRDGLLVYAPVFLILFLVFRKDIRDRIGDFPLLAAIFLSYVLFHAFTTVRGAYSPAARPVMYVIWIMAVFAIAVYRRNGETGKTLFRFLAGLTGFATVWLFYFPFFLYQPVTRDVSQRASSLLLFLGSSAVNLSSLFPSFLKMPNAGYLPNWIWLLLLACAVALYYARASVPFSRKAAAAFFPVLTAVLIMLLCAVPHVQLGNRYRAGKHTFFNNSRNFLSWPESKSYQILAGKNYDLYLEADRRAPERLEFVLRNPQRIALCVRSGRRRLLDETRAAETRIALSRAGLQSFYLGKKKLLHVGLEAGSAAGEAFFWLEIR